MYTILVLISFSLLTQASVIEVLARELQLSTPGVYTCNKWECFFWQWEWWNQIQCGQGRGYHSHLEIPLVGVVVRCEECLASEISAYEPDIAQLISGFVLNRNTKSEWFCKALADVGGVDTSPSPTSVECRYWDYTCGNVINNVCYCCAGSYPVYDDPTVWNSRITCQLCVIGKYQDLDLVRIPSTMCVDCPAGKYTLEEGAKSINDCVPLPPPAVPTATIPCGSEELFIDNAYCPHAGQVRQYFSCLCCSGEERYFEPSPTQNKFRPCLGNQFQDIVKGDDIDMPIGIFEAIGIMVQ